MMGIDCVWSPLLIAEASILHAVDKRKAAQAEDVSRKSQDMSHCARLVVDRVRDTTKVITMKSKRRLIQRSVQYLLVNEDICRLWRIAKDRYLTYVGIKGATASMVSEERKNDGL